MALHLIDLPIKRQVEEYTNCVDFLVDKIKKEKGVLAIYQFGSVTTAGISDIDLLIVFEDGVRCDIDPFENFPPHFSGLFTHGIDAMSVSFFRQTHLFALWQNMNLMFGSEIKSAPEVINEKDLLLLKTQTALEFLVTNYIDLIVQFTYGIFKLRAFLQHTKGLIYDFDLLNIHDGKLYDMVVELRTWIKEWNQSPPASANLIQWLIEFRNVYEAFIQQTFSQKNIFVPPLEKYFYIKNVELKKGTNKIKYNHRGFILPNLFSFAGKKFYNLQHKLSNFEFEFPMVDLPDGILKERYIYFEEMKKYNKANFPYFDTLTTGFRVYDSI